MKKHPVPMRLIEHRRILQSADASFVCRTDLPFSAPLHYHDEYELIYVASGRGIEFVDSGFAPYEAGSLTLIGGNTPHLHLCDRTQPAAASCEILYFSPRLFPAEMEHIPEYRTVHALLSRSLCGIRFTSERDIAEAVSRMGRLPEASGVARLLGLIELLDRLGSTPETFCLSPGDPFRQAPCGVDEPLRQIESFLYAHFRRRITLEEVAAQVGLTPTSLCRYFRKRTGRTLFRFLSEIRVSQACRLLARPDLTVAQAAAEAGFFNLSHFNKQFRSLIRQTPTEYRRRLGIM